MTIAHPTTTIAAAPIIEQAINVFRANQKVCIHLGTLLNVSAFLHEHISESHKTVAQHFNKNLDNSLDISLVPSIHYHITHYDNQFTTIASLLSVVCT